MNFLTSVSAVLLILSCVNIHAETTDWLKLRDDVRRLRAELARQGAYAFVTNTATTPRVAPHIHSQHWVDRLPATEIDRKAYEQEKRDFGLDFVGKLEDVALPVFSLDDIEGRERYTCQLLDIAQWLKTSHGYGNFILKRWSEGIAASAMGVLAVSSAYDTDRVGKLLSRFDGLLENFEFQVEILNEESPDKYKVPNCSNFSKAYDSMEYQWFVFRRKSYQYFKKNYKGDGWFFDYDEVKDDPSDLVFYVPHHLPCKYRTVRAWWAEKNHEVVCVYGMDDRKVENLRAILEFRTYVGDIPVPTAKELSDDEANSEYRDKLFNTWSKITGKGYRKPACSDVSDIFKNDYRDRYSLYLLRERGDKEPTKESR